MDPVLRPARPVDLGAVEALVARAYAPWIARIGQRPGPMRDDYARRISRGEVHVLDAAGGITGLVVLVAEREALLVDNVAVDPAAQGLGYGGRLMRFAEDTARGLGLMRLRLYTHVRMAENIALYTRAGYRETHRATEEGLDRVFMQKTICAPAPQDPAP